MINKLPIIGWFFSTLGAASMAVPFYFIWNALAPTYFYQLPPVYQHVPFWHCVGLFIVIPIVKGILTPQFFNVTQNNTNEVKEK